MDGAAWDARYAEGELIWSAGPNRYVAAEVDGLSPGRAVDLAAGEGRNAIWLAGLGWDVVAVDFSAVGLAKGRQLAESFDDGREARIVWHQADLTDYVPEPGGYDLAVLCYLQVVASQRRAIVRNAVQALAPGGVLVVIGHDSTNLTHGTGGPQDPAVLFTPQDIVDDLTGSGVTLRIEKAVRAERVVDGAPRPAIDAVVRVVALGE